MSGRACLHRLLPARKGCHGTASVCGRPDAGAEKCHRCGASFTCPHDHRGGNHMRIIAGTARSLPLKAPEGMDTRPTTDRIKETLFNIIQDEVPGAYFLDLFAGSGQMGLEAVSRGARYAVFVDNGKKPAACIEENIRFTKFEHQTKLYPTEVLSALRAMEGKYQFDLIFMDPPYRKGMEQEVLRYLAGSSLLKEDTVLIVEAALDTDFSYLDEYGMTLSRLKMYKTNEHAFIRRK
ncbi:16S rRNA (guanine(966)-N(2))-methyltransferase RsmD [Roseburia hominis]|nr:16S rRNA (guanine(966)-N(2))-methyltransferase RsmD [Roseburia hominis]MCL3784471.1 16S rRNA (guanine(966)-N(2))-methyltransferase RsmD [Roseburia hominis]